MTRQGPLPGSTVRRHQRGGAVFAVLGVATFAYMFIQSMTVPVLTTIQNQFDADQSTVTWVLTAYLLSSAVSTPIMGRIGDLVGRNRVLVLCLAALAIGSAAAALAPTIGVLLAARVVQGLGGGVLSLAYSVLRDEVPREQLTARVGQLSALMAIGSVSGLVAAGPVVDAFGYAWLFWLPALVTAAAAVASALVIPSSPSRSSVPFSVLPALLLSGWLVCLLLGISRAPSWGWGSAAVLGLLGAALVLGLLWALVELRSDSPLIDLRLMSERPVWTTNLISFLLGVAMFGSWAYTPLFTQTPPEFGYGFGVSVTVAGLMLVPSALGNFGAGLVNGSLMRAVSARTVAASAFLLVTASMLIQAFWNETIPQMLVANLLGGIGFGLLLASIPSVIVAAVPPDQTGAANGMSANIRGIGGALGTAVLATIISGHVAPGGYPAESDYAVGFATVAAVALLGAVASWAVPDGYSRVRPRLEHSRLS